jgi:hypothetical protein
MDGKDRTIFQTLKHKKLKIENSFRQKIYK